MGIRHSDQLGRAVRAAAVAGACALLANCAQNGKFSRVDPKYGVSSSPRVVAFGVKETDEEILALGVLLMQLGRVASLRDENDLAEERYDKAETCFLRTSNKSQYPMASLHYARGNIELAHSIAATGKPFDNALLKHLAELLRIESRGYDAKTMRAIVRLRKMETHDRQEAEALLDTYKAALGLA